MAGSRLHDEPGSPRAPRLVDLGDFDGMFAIAFWAASVASRSAGVEVVPRISARGSADEGQQRKPAGHSERARTV